MRKRKKKYDFQVRRQYKLKQLLIIATIIVACLTLVTVLARYVMATANDFFVRTQEFYFFSDKLEETTAHYEIDNWSGVDDYNITINMNSRDNNLKSVDYDISYDIEYSCSSNIVCQLSKTSGIISANTNTDFFVLKITPNKLLESKEKVSVSIRVHSTSHFDKTLSGEFILEVGKEDLSYEIKDSANAPYLDVSLTNTLSYYTISESFESYSVGDRIDREKYLSLSEDNRRKCYSAMVTLKFDPNVVILDMTNTNYLNATDVKTTTIDGKKFINEITFKVEAISSSNVRFYKNDITQDYTYPIINSSSIVTVTST